MERITGPYHGFYIASYACETGAAERYLGYAKVCRRRPESYWDAHCLVKLCGEALHSHPDHAMAEVERQAREQLGGLVPDREPAVAV
jgi:hypothetical protein